MKNLILRNTWLLILILANLTINAQTELLIPPDEGEDIIAIIKGETSVEVGNTNIYSVLVVGTTVNTGNWIVNGGLKLSQNSTSVTIEWTTEGVGSISYLGTSTDFNIIEGSLNVTVAPVAQIPDTPDTISYNFTDDNYIFTITPQIAVENINEITSNDEAIKNITYFDEIGRPKQKIAIGYSPNSFDIINHYEYDNFGRTAKEFLPIPINELSGELVENVELLGGNYYLEEYNEQVWYSNKKYSDPSFNIVEEQAFPGNDWSIESEHTAKNFVTSNAANEVLKFKVKFWSNGDPYFEKDGYYEANSLIKSVIKDENWKLEDGTKNTTEQFEDKLGRIVLTRTYTTSDIGNSTNIFTPHDTYYIYDDLGRLTYVLPPKVNAVSGFTTEEFYEYKYDERSRLVEKRIPGKETEYIIYNKIDQVVLTQDGNLRANNRWIFNKYDALGRVTYSGIYSDGNSREGMQEMAYNETDNLYERRLYSPINIDGVSAYYSNDAFPFEGQTLAITNINYYDSYVDIDGGIRPVSVYGVETTTNTKGLATVTKTKILEKDSWITAVTYYDDKARPIYIYKKNNYLNTIDIIELKLDDFTGKVLETKSTHKRTGEVDVVIIDRFEYDHAGRLVQQTQKINNQAFERLFKNKYDDLGQLKTKLISNGTSGGYKDLVGVSVSDNVVTKTASDAWGNGGFATNGSFLKDGYLDIDILMTSTYSIIGLSPTNIDANFTSIKYAIYFNWSTGYTIYENGKSINISGSYNIGDLFRIERKGTTIYYKKNGEVIHISEIPSEGKLLGDVAIKFKGRKISVTIVDNEKGLQNVDFNYNIRGWLTQINDINGLADDLFSLKLNYNTSELGTRTAFKKLYNGNISETIWKTINDATTGITRGYAYEYDELNRIKYADYGFKTTSVYNLNSGFDLRVNGYDKNGNITSLYRDSQSPGDAMDDIRYTYNEGNKLLKVVENSTSVYKNDGFKDGTNTGNDYWYDHNGNLSTDINKDISQIMYNHLNLPYWLLMSGKYIENVYTADGVKVARTANDYQNNINSTTEYAGNFIYQDGELQFFGHPEGYVERNAQGTFDYVYQYKDQVGNVRLSYIDANNDGIINTSTSSLFYDDMEDSDGWDSDGAMYGASATFDSEHTISGKKAAKLFSPSAGGLYAHSNVWIPINDNTPTDYIFSGWIYLQSSVNAYARILLFMNEDTETSYFTQIGDGGKIYTKNEWVYIEKRVTIPTNIDKINLRIEVYNNSYDATAWFDNVSIKKVNSDGYTEIIEENNYYPFGLKHKGYNTDISSLGNNFAQKYKTFQGQEFTDNFNLNVHEFRFRVSDPAIGRFWQVDPLAEDYVYNGVYNFSENRVIDAIELEGLEAFYIHGTVIAGQRSQTHMFNKNQYIVRTLTPILGNSINRANTSFTWSGGLNDVSRTAAATYLVSHVLKNRVDGEPISLIGHSHGGNVAIEAANILIRKHKISPDQINIIALNTPRSDKSTLEYDDVNLYNINAINDRVQSIAADTDVLGGSVEPDNSDISIYYEDQLEDLLLDIFNHVGPAKDNAMIWIPLLEEAKDEQLRIDLEFQNLWDMLMMPIFNPY